MNRNNRLQRMLVRKLTAARLRPPTILGLLLSWSSLPLLVVGLLIGVVVPIIRDVLDPVLMLAAGILLGAALRDLGIAIKVVRFWPIQQELLDWPKIEALSQGMAEAGKEAGRVV